MNPYDELSSFVLTILNLLHSNSEIERVFCQMNIIKNKLRNRMKTVSTNALLHIRCGLQRTGKTCISYEFLNIVLDLLGSSEKYKNAKESAGDHVAISRVEEDEDDE